MSTLKIPAMLDPHCHLRGLEWAHKGTFRSETEAALAGGYWAVFDMPNTFPSTITRSALDIKLAEISREALCDWGVYFGGAQLSPTRSAEVHGNWNEFPNSIDDVIGLKLFNNDTTGNLLIDDQRVREEHYRNFPGHKVIAVHAEDETQLQILELVRRYRKPTHFLHVCMAKEIEFLRAAKAEGLPVSIGVCPHHLFLTEDDLPRLGAFGRMKPTLKTKADQAALWKALDERLIDVIESDHAPHTVAEKESERPPWGVPGLQTTLPLLLTAVRERRLDEEYAIRLVSENPRRIFGVVAPRETYTVVDTAASFIFARQQVRSLCGWSPFEGMRMWGKVSEVWIRGFKVFDGEQVLATPGSGSNVARVP